MTTESHTVEEDGAEKNQTIYRYDFNTYLSDDSGYYVTSSQYVDISVNATTKEEALKKVWKAFKGEKTRYNFSRKASLKSVKEVE